MDVLPITSLALLTAAVIAIIDFVRYAKAQDWNGALTIFLAWLAGFGAVLLAANAGYTDHIVLVNDQPPLGEADLGSLVLLGFVIGSLAPVGVKILKAVDSSTTSKSPQLINDK